MVSVIAVYRGLFEGLFRFRALGIIICVQPVVLIISSIALVLLGFGASGAMMGYVVAALLALILYLYYTRDQRFWSAGSVINKEVYAFAVPMFLGMISVHLLMNVDILGVKFFIPGMSDVMSGYYRAALVWAKTPVALIGAITVAFLPFVSHYASDNERVKSYFLKTLKYAFIFILPLTLACFAIPGPLITLIFPESYVAGAQALRILSIGMFLLVLIFLHTTLFQGVGKPKIPALIMTGAIVIQIACLYLLVPRYGLTGAAMATTFASVFGFALLQYVYIKRYGFKLNVVDSGKIVSASVILLATLYFFPMSDRLLTVLGLICGFGVFIGLLAAMKVLAYSDVDVLLSGAFSPESRFRSKVVGFVKRLNMATSESKSPRVRAMERYLPFILALAALVSAMLIVSDVAVAAIFAFTLVIYALRRYDSNILMVAAVALLIVAAILFPWRGEVDANEVAIPAFYFLAIGVVGAFIDFMWQRNEGNKI
jgi:stage V sporulation protein B